MTGEKVNKLQGMDTQILVDSLAVIMGHEEKELCKPGTVALALMLETASTILGSKDRVLHCHFLLVILRQNTTFEFQFMTDFLKISVQ
jgi:hypothetical protein